MDKKYYIINQQGDKREATMLLLGKVGDDINGNMFAEQLKALGESGEYDELNLKINSVGGSVIEGYSIMAAIYDLNEKGINVNTTNVGIAYSIAGAIFLSGKKRTMYDYASLMVHNPFLKNRPTLTESATQMLETITGSIKRIILSNSGVKENKLMELMNEERYLDATESKQYGFADEIMKTGREKLQMQNAVDLMNAYTDIIIQGGKNNNKSNTNIDMEEIQRLKNEISDLNSKIGEKSDAEKAMSAKIETLEKENRQLKEDAAKEKAETLVNSLLEKGLISVESKSKWLQNAVKNFDGTKDLAESLKVSAPPTMDTDPNGGGRPSDKELAKKYEDILNNDPTILDTMNAAEVSAMEKAYAEKSKADVERIS